MRLEVQRPEIRRRSEGKIDAWVFRERALRGVGCYDTFDHRIADREDRERRLFSAAGRADTPDEMANLAALLMGPDGSFITGSDFLMDGGVTAACCMAN